ncbi:SDR family NAD(P)-dependent oxidoreductase [Nocardia jejuensis]|uniref:SDR family NAD(P)-dependent oxidoreductase n=1 Tax=Nocardia jejuensis TaxID=328049 RepID=UPI000A06E305|nr:SDR family NAD(P)-dependent oxidoreductase [Nocardia jejuensis]
MNEQLGAVVITGASSGLGKASALHLAREGFTVYAGVRTEASAEQLRAQAGTERLRPVLLEVTSETSIADAHKLISAELGPAGLHGLVNNAGICVSAPLECVSSDQLRAELEVNLIGTLAVTREFLPLLRARRPGATGLAGRIVNVSSGVGKVASPYLGAYAASQFGKEGLSGSLRRELAPLGVAVSIVAPGAIATPIWGKLADTADRIMNDTPPEIAEVYRRRFTGFVAANAERAASSRTRPQQVADAVQHAMTASNPRIRYQVGTDSVLVAAVSRLLPDRVLDFAIARGLPIAD